MVARRTALDVLRARYGRDFRLKELREISLDARTTGDSRLADGRTPEHELQQREWREQRQRLQAALAAALTDLPPGDAMLVQAVYFEGLKIGEAGRRLGVRAVYKRLSMILARLRLELAQTPGGNPDLLAELLQGEQT